MVNRYCHVHKENDMFMCTAVNKHGHVCCRFCDKQCSHPCRGTRDNYWRTCSARLSFWRFHFEPEIRS